MPRTKGGRKKRREPPEGYKWARGGTWHEKDLSHPMWQNENDESSSEDSSSDDEIERITAHADKHDRDNVDDGLPGSKRLKTVTPQVGEKIKDWSSGIRIDMTCKEFGMHLLAMGRDVVGSKDFLVGAVKAMCIDLGIPVGHPKVVVEQPKPMPQSMHPKGLKAFDVPGDSLWDSNAYFTSKRDGETSLSYTAAASAKSRDIARIQDAIKVCGTVAHASVALHHFVTKLEPQIGINLGVVRNPEEKVAAAVDILLQIKELIHSPRVSKRNTNDAMSLQKTLFAVITPAAPTNAASNEDKRNHKTALNQIFSQLGIKGSMRKRVIEASNDKRDLLEQDTETIMETKLVKVHRRKEHCNRIVTPEFLESFKEYLLTCEVTYDSPNRKDCVFAKDWNGNRIRDGEKGGYVLARNRYYQRGLGWLYKHSIRTVEDGGFLGFRDEEGNICVSQTTMERMMPHNYKRMTNTLKSSCRCSSCLDAEYLHEDLMSWRNQHLKDLERAILAVIEWLETNKSMEITVTYNRREQKLGELRQEKVDFTKDVFRTCDDGSLLQKVATMEESIDLMTCQKVGPSSCFGDGDMSKFHPYKCCIGRCKACPSLPPNRGEHHEEEYMILWRKHEHRNWCKIHGAIESGTCSECLALPEINRPIEKPRKTYDSVRKTAPINEFMRNHYSKYNVEVYRQHVFLRRALGKNWCKRLRDPYVMLLLELHRSDVHTIWDFADRMACEYNNATMTEGMGGSAKNIGMEGCCYHMLEEALDEVHRHWYGFLSDEKQQDARICFVNRRNFIEDMQRNGKLTEGATLWIQTDGCGKQYKCHNFLQMHILLAKMYKIRIDVMITTAGHGKCLVDSLAGTDKHFLDKGRISEMDSTRVDEHSNSNSEAYKACIFLSSVDRMLGSYKHTRQTADMFEVKSRKYSVTNYDPTKMEDEARAIPFKNTNFGPVSGWKSGTKNGIKEMYHFRFDYRVASNTAMARRIPCACNNCTSTLDKEWVGWERDPEVGGTQRAPERVHPRHQPSYQQPADCVFRKMMMDGDEDLNQWHFVDVAPVDNKCDDQELDDFFTTVMETRIKAIESEIVVAGIGALSATTDEKEHGFYLIQWTKKPHTLQAPSKVFGIKDKLSAGQVVCEGVFWDRVDHSNDWYEPQETTPCKRPKKVLVQLSQVLCGKVCFKPYVAGSVCPPKTARVSSYNRHNLSKLIRLGAEELDFLQNEQIQREGFELVALDRIEKTKQHTNNRNNKMSDRIEESEDEYIDDSWEQD